MREIILQAPATIANFGPGFDIFALALEEPHDVVKVRQNHTQAIRLRVTGRAEGIPTSLRENTAGLAALSFYERVRPPSGVDVEIVKRMTSCAGLGSSGAAAAGCVFGLNRLFGAQLQDDEIIEIARTGEVATGGAAHADNVAGCLLGGFVLIKKHHPVEVVKIEVPEIPIVLCAIRKPQQTSRGLIPSQISLTEAKEQMSFCSSLVYAVSKGSLREIGEAVNLDYISEPVRSRFIPDYREVKTRVLKAGAYGCNVSGGGSSLFAICEIDKTAEVAAIMNTHFTQRGVENEVIITRASNRGIIEIDEL